MLILKAWLLVWTLVTFAACGGGGGGGDATPADTTPPTVALTAPLDGTTVTGVTQVTASAADDVGVSRVEFYLNGALQGSDSTSPYSLAWEPSTLARGSYTWTAKAYDAAGNVQQSAAVTVTVPIFVTMNTVVSGAGAVGTVSLAGLPVAAPYGLNFVVTMPAGAGIASVAASGPYAANGLASTSGPNTIILASSSIASGEIMTVNFAGVPAGAQPGDFGISLSAVFDGNGNQIQ